MISKYEIEVYVVKASVSVRGGLDYFGHKIDNIQIRIHNFNPG